MYIWKDALIQEQSRKQHPRTLYIPECVCQYTQIPVNIHIFAYTCIFTYYTSFSSTCTYEASLYPNLHTRTYIPYMNPKNMHMHPRYLTHQHTYIRAITDYIFMYLNKHVYGHTKPRSAAHVHTSHHYIQTYIHIHIYHTWTQTPCDSPNISRPSAHIHISHHWNYILMYLNIHVYGHTIPHSAAHVHTSHHFAVEMEHFWHHGSKLRETTRFLLVLPGKYITKKNTQMYKLTPQSNNKHTPVPCDNTREARWLKICIRTIPSA